MMSQSSGASVESCAGALFSQRIVYVDSYTNFPIPQLDPLYSTFRGAEVKRVPVIRVYGATPKGQKTCTHVHGVFPYLYILDEPRMENLLQRLSLALDRAINSSLGGGNTDGIQHVFKIVKVHGRTFYGFKKDDSEFLRIYFYSPIALSKATDLLQSGKILGHRFQAHESHIPYILQFLMDFKLYGMNFIHLSGVKFRGIPSLELADSTEATASGTLGAGTGFWDIRKLPPHLFLPSTVLKSTRCEIEIDVSASEIIVSQSISGKNPGIEAIWNDERERRRLHGLADWAQVAIPDSQARPEQSYIFKREAELMEVLRGQLQDVSPNSNVPASPMISQEEYAIQPRTPSSQVLIDSLEVVSSQEGLSWNQNDEDMVAFLEQMALERRQESDPDSYDVNSILGSQEFEEDPYSQSTVEESNDHEYCNIAAEDEEADDEENNCWTQDFFSDTMLLAAVEESEEKSRQASGGGFMIDQADGQCDGSSDSDSDDSQIPGTPPEDLPTRPARVSNSPKVSLPLPSVNASSEDDEVSFICEVKSPVKSVQSKPKIRVSAPDSPEIHDPSSSSDESVKMIVEDECLGSDEDETVAMGITNLAAAESELNACEDENLENGITSFYEYPGDTLTQEQSQSLLVEDDAGENPGSQESITSFYKYSSDEDNEIDERSEESEEANTFSQDEAMTSSPMEASDTDPREQVNLSFDERKLALARKRRNRKMQGPLLYIPFFDNEVLPLRRVPNQDSFEAYKIRVGKIKPPRDPLSMQYFREMETLDPANRKKSEAREKVIQDMLHMTRALQQVMIRRENEPEPEPRNLNFIFPAPLEEEPQKPVKDSDTESDEDDVPGLVKPFGFGRFDNDSDGGESLSDMSEDDKDTIIPSPASSHSQSLPPSPLVCSQESVQGSRTPKSLLKNPRKICKKRRLTWGEQSDSSSQPSPSPSNKVRKTSEHHYPQLRLNESELDSVYFSSQSPATGVLDTSNFQNAKALHECQFLTKLSMEVLCSARNNLTPDPIHDSILAIYFTLYRDNPERSDDCVFGCFQIDPAVARTKSVRLTKSPLTSPSTIRSRPSSGPPSDDIQFFSTEMSLILNFIAFVQSTDPDILTGYEILKSSWGYLIERGTRLGIQMTAELSRLLPLPRNPRSGFGDKSTTGESWNETISGRIVINLWRLLRHEITVTSYTFENAVFQILHERTPLWTYRVLHDYFKSDYVENRAKVKSYFRTRVEYVIRIIEKLDLINRTSELARLFGIQFFEVLSRGSQFRVESMMLRLAKPANLIPPSPNPMQRGSMKAPEYLPLIMEPESKFYQDPVAVLDFQSLYPSMMMAYNYCFSTCVGRVQYMGEDGAFQLGCLSQSIPPVEVATLMANDQLHISPCGVIFVKSEVRKGILGEMLAQILDTRQMVKRSMKKWKDDVALQKVLDSRQLGLKLIANVTYGYTSANFSGRMPCVDIADSVVSKGRETLQRAIDYVKENEALFEAKVVYGDTDSLFLHFPGKTRAEAFVLAQRIVDDVTAMNPKPVKLKLEKVYQPCILQTKKRYVGFSYETPEQTEPKYEAKGIETVRRDGCPATAKILEGTLKTLFVTQDEAAVRKYVQEQFRKIFMGRVSLNKYTFAREYRGRDGYKPTAVVPALEISKKLSEKDPRSEPLPNQRVPYIVVYGNPGLPLIQLVRRPAEFIENHNLRLNAHYYIEKAIIPALNRCLALAGFSVGRWYAEMPRKYLKSHYTEGTTGKKGTIDQYFKSESCVKCECRTVTGLCESCFPTTQQARQFLRDQEMSITDKYEKTCNDCRRCSSEVEMICMNMDCPVKHRFLRYERDYQTKLPNIQKLSRKINLVDWEW